MPPGRFPPPWSVEEQTSCFVVRESRRAGGRFATRSTNPSGPPQIGPCVHTIRDEHLMPPLGWEKRVRRPECKRPPGQAASCLIAEQPGIRGMGRAAQLPPCYGRIDHKQLTSWRSPAIPWHRARACFVVRDASGRALVYVYLSRAVARPPSCSARMSRGGSR